MLFDYWRLQVADCRIQGKSYQGTNGTQGRNVGGDENAKKKSSILAKATAKSDNSERTPLKRVGKSHFAGFDLVLISN